MKKILHISKYYYPFIGGVEQTARDCVNALKGKYEQKVICFNHKKGTAHEFVDQIEVIRCGCQIKISSQSISFNMKKQLQKLIEEFKPDYILFHYPNPFVSTILLPLLTSKNKLVLYWHLDIIKQKLLKKIFYFQNINLINKAYRIIATSPNYIKGSSFLARAEGKCIVVPSCINEERLNINNSIIEIANEIRKNNFNKIICLAVGRHVPYKGFESLIRASKELDECFSIYIIGKGPLTNKFKKLAKGDPKIHFMGMIEDDFLKAFYLATDIFCFPSITKNEAFGLALAEAMYFGSPAVTYHVPGSGVNYVSLNGLTGIEVENSNYKNYAEAIKKLGRDSTLRTEMGIQAKKRVKDNFLYIHYQENILKVFQDS